MTTEQKIDSHNISTHSISKIDVVVVSGDNKSPSKRNQDHKLANVKNQSKAKEVGGRGGLEPTRFGNWEKNGRCIDF